MRTARSQAEFESRSHWFTESSLEESLRSGECLVCSNLIHAERDAIQSFLWEGMMSPQVRTAFLHGGGFCSRHFGIAKRIEQNDWPAGGIGVAILCENLVESAAVQLPGVAELNRREPMNLFRRKHAADIPPVGADCIFCHDWMERENSLIEILEYLKNKPKWSERFEQSPLCVHHALLAFHLWRGPADKLKLRAALEARLQQLHADLREFIRKHDWNRRHEPFGREKDAVQRAIQILTGPQRQFAVLKAGAEGGGSNGTRER